GTGTCCSRARPAPSAGCRSGVPVSSRSTRRGGRAGRRPGGGGGGAGGPAGAVDADGWLETGALGHRDQDGYLFLAGRSDDVINRGGEKIYPREIEEFLLTQPGVRSAAVVAASDEVLGQRPVAYVIPASPDLAGPNLAGPGLAGPGL